MNPVGSIAIVGMACHYPDARSPAELFENALAQRRAFRRIPDERLRLADYYSEDKNAPDRTYSSSAAVIRGYEFDRVRFRVSGPVFRSVDLTHWLALDVAAQALADAGFESGQALPCESTGVFIGNTLAGEFARANVMRLRWPYVRRVVDAQLSGEGWSDSERTQFASNLEREYKSAFPSVTEETLAGGMSNTIAGRICNHFNLNGGGYTVDGACASSLLAVANAAAALVSGDLDVALAGGVDLSLDPFELVGFAKAGALATDKMRVFDTNSAGFWPGEGCGIVVLMRAADAVEQHRRVYALLRGWGISSDGSGGMTRPEVDGQLLALHRAYRRAGFGPDSVGYFEAHGTGTAVGDATETAVLTRALQNAQFKGPAPVLSTVKGNIGHTKAAAGVAGLIKATMAVHSDVLPPITGCDNPRADLRDPGNSPLRLLAKAEPWPAGRLRRAAVSAMGFGGINVHVVLEEGEDGAVRPPLLPAPAQDSELFLFAAESRAGLLDSVRRVAGYAARLSEAELTDLAAELQRVLGNGSFRAVCVAGSPQELSDRLDILLSALNRGTPCELDSSEGVFFADSAPQPRIGFLFPGQGSPGNLSGGYWARRFLEVQELYEGVNLSHSQEPLSTDIAQPAIVRATLAGLRVLKSVNIAASIAVGHSLGELAALHWAEAFGEETLLHIAAERGKAMARVTGPRGAMASLFTSEESAREILNGEPVVIAGLNSRSQTVVSGEARAVAAVMERARERGVEATSLGVSHAFHSPLVASAVPELSRHLNAERFQPLKRTVVSTVTGRRIGPEFDLRDLICRQVTLPVRFVDAVVEAARDVDFWIEVGPGRVLSRLASETTGVHAVAVNAGGDSLRGLLNAVAAAFVLGGPVHTKALFEGRIARPFDLDWKPVFFRSPCESAPVIDRTAALQPAPPEVMPLPATATAGRASDTTALETIRALIAERAELPLDEIREGSRLLSDLHLNSIVVGQVVVEAARRLGAGPPIAPTQYADARISEVAAALDEARRIGGVSPEHQRVPAGVDAWIRCFEVELVERPLESRPLIEGPGSWTFVGNGPVDLLARFQRAFAHAPGRGIAVCLLSPPNSSDGSLLLRAAREAQKLEAGGRFVLVQSGAGAAFIRTLYLEMPDLDYCVVDVPASHSEAPSWAVQEALSAQGYAEAHYDANGKRRRPFLRVVRPESWRAVRPALGPSDVLLVTGGGKGITAECALDLGRSTGARLGLLGRSIPDTDPVLAANLERFSAAGLDFRYLSTDVTDSGAVTAAIAEVTASLGPVTAILHGAGGNVPQLIAGLDERRLAEAATSKVAGLENVLRAVDPDRVRLLVTFGSLIARTGLRGEAHYGIANEWLRILSETWARRHPNCRCLHLDWSVWAGVGMGERLGRMDALMQLGVTPIPIDEGLRILRGLVNRESSSTSLVVCGRFGDPPTISLNCPELPFVRFLEQVRSFVPGVELIADAEVSVESDPYLADHVYAGERLLPGVVGLEAMAQVAMPLLETTYPPDFENVEFLQAIVIPPSGAVKIRVAALVLEEGSCRVVVRCSATGFQVDHFRALCRQGRGERSLDSTAVGGDAEMVPLDPEKDLYGNILFHAGRFRRLNGYHRLRAMECLAEIAPGPPVDWFWRYLPGELVLGDPAVRDAAIHAIQACIPQASLLPVAVHRISTYRLTSEGAFVHALERESTGDTFTYDVEIAGTDGAVLERWEGVKLGRIVAVPENRITSAPLLGPYLERRVRDLLPGWNWPVVVERSAQPSSRSSDLLIRRAIGLPYRLMRRPDGKPEVCGGRWNVSAAYNGDVVVAVAATSPTSCDVELVEHRPESVWMDLIGPARYSLAALVAKVGQMDLATAATHVWTASECLIKVGAVPDSPLMLDHLEHRGVLFACGSKTIASLQVEYAGTTRVFAFLSTA